MVHDAGNIGDCIEECLDIALEMEKSDPRVYIPQQFTNPNNPRVHKHHTALEILEQVAGEIHGFCSGIGTGGSISGIGEVLKAQFPDILIWAVDRKTRRYLRSTIGNTADGHRRRLCRKTSTRIYTIGQIMCSDDEA